MVHSPPLPHAADPIVSLLRLGARVDGDAAACARLTAAAARLHAWDDLPALAEAHGLGPLLHAHLARAGVEMPNEVRRQLLASSVRHRDANRVRFRVLGEILDAFGAADIPVVVLKGAALAHVLYASPGLRPLSDIDLLVDARLARRAQSTLADIGFAAPLDPATRQLVSHHHLPAAVKPCDGHVVQVEIHLDAITRDAAGSLSTRRLMAPTRRFTVEGRTAHALGHEDMLYHLCRHLAECASLLRLIWVADVVGYATRFRDEIAWDELRRHRPFVPNALALLHLVTPLPDALQARVRPAAGDGVRGVGLACKPLSEIVKAGRPLRDIGRDLFDPSDWWLRLHYGVDERRSLALHRTVVHPLHVAYWFIRRAVASAQPWKLSK